MTAIQSVDAAARETENWIDDFVERLGWRDRNRAYSALIASLHALRDCLHRDPGVDAEQVARAMFALLAERLPPTEVEDAKASTPHELHNLWPN